MTTPVDVPPEFGPDHTVGGDTTPFPDEVKAEKPKSARKPRTVKDTFGALGRNKAYRSGIRTLTTDDHVKLVGIYDMIGGMISIIHPKLGGTFSQRMPTGAFTPDDDGVMTPEFGASTSERCVDAWFDLAANNDGVRRVILACVEGGQWGKVFMAHLPLLIAALPESVVQKAFQFGPLGTYVPQQQTESPNGNPFPADFYGPDGKFTR